MEIYCRTENKMWWLVHNVNALTDFRDDNTNLVTVTKLWSICGVILMIDKIDSNETQIVLIFKSIEHYIARPSSISFAWTQSLHVFQ